MRRPRDLREGLRALAGPRVRKAVCFSSALVAAVVFGCGPVEYLGQVRNKAARAVAEAKQAGAERTAPYEYTSAVEYLNKAREEAGQAEYQIAVEYGRRSEDFALRARAIAEQAARRAPGRAPAGGDGADADAPAGASKDSS